MKRPTTLSTSLDNCTFVSKWKAPDWMTRKGIWDSERCHTCTFFNSIFHTFLIAHMSRADGLFLPLLLLFSSTRYRNKLSAYGTFETRVWEHGSFRAYLKLDWRRSVLRSATAMAQLYYAWCPVGWCLHSFQSIVHEFQLQHQIYSVSREFMLKIEFSVTERPNETPASSCMHMGPGGTTGKGLIKPTQFWHKLKREARMGKVLSVGIRVRLAIWCGKTERGNGRWGRKQL